MYGSAAYQDERFRKNSGSGAVAPPRRRQARTIYTPAKAEVQRKAVFAVADVPRRTHAPTGEVETAMQSVRPRRRHPSVPRTAV